jgi:leucyl/phenylalanyl-tRNA--protein transferase
MPVFWLSEEVIEFPPPELASNDGILAVGGDLSPQRLLKAYRMGIFPWFNPDDPILWWSPNPRFVLFPDELKVAKSMRPFFNQRKFEVTYDRQFHEVIRNCQNRRPGQWGGTWITEGMVEAYCRLHELGYAHSVEVWKEGELAGGLYGISLGKCFFGESMFTKENNASKFGFITLARQLQTWGFWLIDCQQQTEYLRSFGARSVPRTYFLDILKKNEKEETLLGNWEKIFHAGQ